MGKGTTPILASGAKRLALEAQGMFEQADREGRALTGEERSYVKDLLDRAKEQREFEGDMTELGLGAGMESSVFAGGQSSGGGPGDMFVRSEGFKKISDPGSRPQTWTTGAVDVSFQ